MTAHGYADLLRHEVPGMRGLYTHVSDRMRETLVEALQARWKDSLRARAAIRPHSPSPCSTNCWHPTAARRTQAPPSAPSGIWQPAHPLGGREKLISQIPPKQSEGPIPEQWMRPHLESLTWAYTWWAILGSNQ
jgi:hypothetical protein